MSYCGSKRARVLGYGKTVPTGNHVFVVECGCGAIRAVRPKRAIDVARCHQPAAERDDGDGLERRCKQCGDWWFIDQYWLNAGSGLRGRKSICSACSGETRNDRRRNRKASEPQ